MTTPFTLIDDGQSHVFRASVQDGKVALEPEQVRDQLGWELKREGLCQDNVCIPVRERDRLVGDEGLDLEELARLLGRPLALAAEAGAAALAAPHHQLASRMANLQAPDFTLPDLEGKLHSLSEHRGKKVLLIAYASW